MAANSRLVVFDWDGTLVDSFATILEAFSQAFSAAAVPAPRAAAVRRVVGLTLAEAVEMLAPGQPAKTRKRLAAGYRQAYTALLAGGGASERLFAGVDEVLRLLVREGWVLGIATGKSQRGLAEALTRHGLSRRFATLQTADQGPGKPHPAMLERAMAEVGVAPEATVMVGDTAFDMAMARAAGARAVGVTWGFHPAEELRDAGALAVLETMDELPALLRSIL